MCKEAFFPAISVKYLLLAFVLLPFLYFNWQCIGQSLVPARVEDAGLIKVTQFEVPSVEDDEGDRWNENLMSELQIEISEKNRKIAILRKQLQISEKELNDTKQKIVEMKNGQTERNAKNIT